MLAPTHDLHPFLPASPEEKDAVCAQLEKLLQSIHFRNSRRYPALLRYIVEETLEGRGAQLKERVLGIEVFGRAPEYDTASDPIVRVTVAEIRKRIAQYYHEDAHGAELRIELTPGSYVPEFLHPKSPEEHAGAEQRSAIALPGTTLSPAAIPAEPDAPAVAVPAWRRVGLWVALVAVLLVAGGSAAAWRWTRPTASDQLWAPLFATKGPIAFCLPISARKNGLGTARDTNDAIAHAMDLADKTLPASGTFFEHQLLGENVVYSDVLAMMKLEAVVEQQHRQVRVRLNFGTNLNDLREGPAIFIGGLSNQWTLQVIAPLRYRFAGSDVDQYYIQDAKAPGKHDWSVRLGDQYTSVNRDYAIIARVHSEAMGQVVMIVAGVGMTGTAAAGEFLADPARAAELQKVLGAANLRDRDFEVVLQTDVINGVAGAAEIIAFDVR